MTKICKKIFTNFGHICKNFLVIFVKIFLQILVMKTYFWAGDSFSY